MHNQILGFFMLTTVALGILAATQWNHSRQLRAEATDRRELIDAMNVNLDGQRARIETMEKEADQLRHTVTQLKRDNGALRDATNELGRLWTEALQPKEDPQGAPDDALPKDALDLWYRARQLQLVEEVYGELLVPWSLEAEQEASLRNALLDWQRLNLLARSGMPDTPAPPELKNADEVEARLQSLLTPEQMAEFQAFVRTLPDRLWLRPLQQDLAQSGHPLTDLQFRRLLQVHWDARQHLPPLPEDETDAKAMQEARATREATIHKRVLSEAPKFLDDEQVEALKLRQPGGP